LTPATIGFTRFNEFNRQVEAFIIGSEKFKLDQVTVSIGAGSYKLVLILPPPITISILPDLQKLQQQDTLDEIDPKRADILRKWQNQSKTNKNLQYTIRPNNSSDERGAWFNPIELSFNTDYQNGQTQTWVKVEKYLFGTILDMGGSHKANVHIRLDSSDQVVILNATHTYLRNQRRNHLYHKALVRVQAEQHYRTGKLRNIQLLSFEQYQPIYDEAALNQFAEIGKLAWADVPDAATWVYALRGN
jgi:hypothetical protein